MKITPMYLEMQGNIKRMKNFATVIKISLQFNQSPKRHIGFVLMRPRSTCIKREINELNPL